ncbi:hypothetical protein SUGI_0382620 [Cryptomeria japonica]|nr:hypothetical protein SUGI_0382620 [Cryptomeria japonica]
MDRVSGSGFASKNQYLFGSFNMKIKLVPGNSAGTVTAYYMSSDSLEQRIRLWFDPSADFHNYSILWNQEQIVFGVDSIPIRVFKNNEGVGVPYLKNQPMKIISTLWNGEDWATDGGKVKIDWSKAPLVASYQGFEVDGCVASAQSCSGHWWEQPEFQGLSQKQLNRLKWVERNYMLYDYCKDKSGRFSSLPPECAINP